MECKPISEHSIRSDYWHIYPLSFFIFRPFLNELNSYIVNFKAIIGIKNDVITLEDLTTLNISRSKRKIFHSRFADYLGGKYKRNR